MSKGHAYLTILGRAYLGARLIRVGAPPLRLYSDSGIGNADIVVRWGERHGGRVGVRVVENVLELS